MPFVRQNRDRRGFDHTLVMHVTRPASGPQRTRVLYLFRSPAGLRVGRTALDAEVMEALEHTHPDLSFNWDVMMREAIVTRQEPAQRSARGQRQRPPDRPQDRSGLQRPPAVAAAEAVEHSTVLSQGVGTGEAARLRHRYRETLHRIGRRARTPEDRERLLERARRLNPDSWTDEATVRSLAVELDAECDRIAAELPSRRRGRRGGRRPSGIMAEGDGNHAETHAPVVDPPGGASDSGGDAGLGTADPETDIPSGD